MMSIMIPVLFMAGPTRRPTPAEIAAEAAAKAAEERGRLDARRQIAMRRALEEHTAKTNWMARIESRLPKLKGAAEDIVMQMHRELLGPEIGKTAHGHYTGTLFGRTRFKGAAKVADWVLGPVRKGGTFMKPPTFMKGANISEEDAGKRAGIAKAVAEGLVRAHNVLTDERNKIATELGCDPANLSHITFDDLVDRLVDKDKMRYEQKDRRDEAFEAMKRRLKSLRPDPEMKKAWDEKVEAMKNRHTQEFGL